MFRDICTQETLNIRKQYVTRCEPFPRHSAWNANQYLHMSEVMISYIDSEPSWFTQEYLCGSESLGGFCHFLLLYPLHNKVDRGILVSLGPAGQPAGPHPMSAL